MVQIKRWLPLVVLVLLFFRWLIVPLRVDGMSMYPTLADREIVLGIRPLLALQRGDLVVVRSDRLLIKRVIALQGEKVQFDKGQLLINHIPVEEDYVSIRDFWDGQWQVGDNQVFLAGDNRPISRDSRQLGTFEEKDIVAKALLGVRLKPFQIRYLNR